MSVATLPYDLRSLREPPASAPRHQRGNGRVAIAFARAGAATVVADLDQQAPCRALFPRPPAGVPLAVLVNTAGGLAGGDRVTQSVAVGVGAAATVTTQAAEKVYRSLGPDARVETRLAIDDAARLEWLPQETILFDGARLDRSIAAEMAEGGRLLACEMLVFGRVARGEAMRSGSVRDAWRITRGSRLTWVDRLGIEGDVAARLDGPGFGGARALATVVYVGPDAPEKLAPARLAAEAAGGAATLVNGVLVARLLGAEPTPVRDGLARVLGWLRDAGMPPPWIH